MKKIKIKKMISYLIANKKYDVLNALVLSDIAMDIEITDSNLLTTIMDQLKNGNEKLIVNLGNVIDQNFDLNPLFDGEDYSNFNFGEFWKKNKTGIVSGGANLLMAMFKKKGNNQGLPQPSGSGGNNDFTQIMLIQQQAAAAKEAREDARRKEEAASRKNTMIIIGSIGGLVVVGGILAIILTRKKN